MVRRFGAVGAVLVAALVIGAAACSSSHPSSTGSTRSPEDQVQDLVAQARAELGADFDDAQISCMATYAVAHPVLLDRAAAADPGATQTPEQSTDLMAMVLGCVPRDQFIGYLVKSLGEPGAGSPALTPAEQACVSSGLATLSSDQLAAMTSDPSAQATLVGAVAPCLLGGSTTTPPATAP
jgi:hypothetical protein